MGHVRFRLRGWLAGGLVLAASGWAAGQQQTTKVPTRETRTTTTTAGIHRISSVIGSTVRLQGGDPYGTIEDIVLNDAGCVEYLVISHDDDYVLVPWAVTTVNYEGRVITVDTTPQRLEPLIFTRDNWPSPADPQFTRRVQEVFGASALRREGRSGGANVQGREDQGGGTVRPQATDRATGDDREIPGAGTRVRVVTPRATGRPAPDGPPRVREITPEDIGRSAPRDQPGGREATPKATGRPEAGGQPGDQDSPGRPR
jgi:hypothetical protein